jgi:hypothetical protein
MDATFVFRLLPCKEEIVAWLIFAEIAFRVLTSILALAADIFPPMVIPP